MTETTDRFRDWDAAYVLGALGTEDRRAFERHLATCTECAAGVAELAGLPGILGKLSPDVAVAQLDSDDQAIDAHLREREHTPGLVQRLALASVRRRRRGRLGMLGAAVAVAAILTVGGVALTSNQAPVAVAAVAMTPQQQSVITASMQVTKKGWGTRFDWSCSYHGADWESAGPASYDLVVTDKSGAQTTVASWSAAGPHASGLSASSRIATGDIRNVEIRLTGSTTPLLTENL